MVLGVGCHCYVNSMKPCLYSAELQFVWYFHSECQVTYKPNANFFKAVNGIIYKTEGFSGDIVVMVLNVLSCRIVKRPRSLGHGTVFPTRFFSASSTDTINASHLLGLNLLHGIAKIKSRF